MGLDKELSPEEKLLRLIRHPGKKPLKEKPIRANPKEEIKAYSQDSPSIVSQSIKNRGSKIILPAVKSINFILINRLIIIVIFLTLIWVFYNSFLNKTNIAKPIVIPSQNLKDDIQISQEKAQDFSYYKEEISKRNLFNSGVIEANPERVIPTSVTFKELIKDLRLLGIVSGERPQVIIEDSKLNKTYFLYVGDILGEVKIEEIYSDRVVLSLKGERISLFL